LPKKTTHTNTHTKNKARWWGDLRGKGNALIGRKKGERPILKKGKKRQGRGFWRISANRRENREHQ
jgi:hypothetical protein